MGEAAVNNGAFHIVRDETENWWTENKVLHFTIPHAALLRNATNTMAVQAFSADAVCRLVFKIIVNA